MSVPRIVPMGVTPATPADPIEQAIAFQAQSVARLADARMIECVTRYFSRGQKSAAVDSAAEAVQAAAITLDAANQELAETIRDAIKLSHMAAVAAKETE